MDIESEAEFPGYALPYTSEQFLLRMEQQRHALIETVRALTDEQICTPVAPDGWSVKDHLAHLASWAAGMVALLKGENRWQGMRLDPAFVAQSEGFEPLNAQLYELHKDASLNRVLTYFNDTHGQLAHAIRGMSHDGLARPYAAFDPVATGEEWQQPIASWLVGNSYGHYAEHLEWIQELIRGQGWQ